MSSTRTDDLNTIVGKRVAAVESASVTGDLTITFDDGTRLDVDAYDTDGGLGILEWEVNSE